MARELAEMDYQFYRPFHLDSTLTERTFGLHPTDLDVPLREIADGQSSRPTPARRGSPAAPARPTAVTPPK